jgi:hypothetical protein
MTAMLHWQNDQQARPLLPGSSHRGLHVVLFISSNAPKRDYVLAKFDELSLPRGVTRAAVCLDGAPETRRWFGISADVALAAISDGVLLALEYECEEGACQRLIELASSQQQMLNAADTVFNR